MADKVVRVDVYLDRNERQDSSADQRRAESGRAERGSNGCKLSLPRQQFAAGRACLGDDFAFGFVKVDVGEIGEGFHAEMLQECVSGPVKSGPTKYLALPALLNEPLVQ